MARILKYMACIFCLYKSLIFNTYFRRFSLPEKNKSPAERNDGGLTIILLYCLRNGLERESLRL